VAWFPKVWLIFDLVKKWSIIIISSWKYLWFFQHVCMPCINIFVFSPQKSQKKLCAERLKPQAKMSEYISVLWMHHYDLPRIKYGKYWFRVGKYGKKIADLNFMDYIFMDNMICTTQFFPSVIHCCCRCRNLSRHRPLQR
jgi:hypothetical protein